MSYTDNLTLAEMREQDAGAHVDLLKKCEHYEISDPQKAPLIASECLLKSCQQLGAKVGKGMPEEAFKAEIESCGIRIEQDDGEGKTPWSAGMYIYKEDELCDFISFPFELKPSPLAINQTPRVIIKTSVKI